jgi:hypothetical protein
LTPPFRRDTNSGALATIPSGKWHGPYLDKIPQDPWGNNYVYCCPGVHSTNGYELYSCGFDGISKSGGDDLDDINNWDPASPHGGNDEYLNPDVRKLDWVCSY